MSTPERKEKPYVWKTCTADLLPSFRATRETYEVFELSKLEFS